MPCIAYLGGTPFFWAALHLFFLLTVIICISVFPPANRSMGKLFANLMGNKVFRQLRVHSRVMGYFATVHQNLHLYVVRNIPAHKKNVEEI